MIYNLEYKEAFLEDLDLQEVSKNRYLKLFDHSGVEEHKMNKDLFDMTFEELEEVFYAYRSKKPRGIIQYAAMIKNYITWAIDNGHSASNTHPIVDTINTEFVEKYVYKEALTYYTREDLIENINNLINVRDKALVLALFEGIRGNKNSEIINLKDEDVYELESKYYAKLLKDEIELEERTIEITNELYAKLKETFDDKTYTSTNGKINTVTDGEYVFRKMRTNDGDCRIKPSTIQMLFHNVIKSSFDDEQITMSAIVESGIMWYTNQLLGENRLITKEIADKVIEKYDMYSIEVNGKMYPSYGRFKDFIIADFFKQNYGDFKFDF